MIWTKLRRPKLGRRVQLPNGLPSVALLANWPPHLIDAVPSDRTELAAALIAWIAGAEFRRSDSSWPDWVDDVDRHDLVRAARVGSDGESAVVVEFVAPSGAQHSASVTIADGRVVDCTLGPADLIAATESTGHFDVEAIALDTAMTARHLGACGWARVVVERRRSPELPGARAPICWRRQSRHGDRCSRRDVHLEVRCVRGRGRAKCRG